jgi:hypothetical protein
MIIDKQQTVIRIFLRKMLLAIITVVIIIAMLATEWFKPELLGITQYQWIIGVAVIYILLTAGSWLRGLNYFYFNDRGDKLVFRYYPIRPLARSKKAVQIPKTALAKYEIVKTNMGLKRVLILHQHVKGNIAKYPPIGITTLTKAELSELEQQLSKYARA